MDLDDLQKKLVAAARRTAPDERVPYAFEKRIMARLASVPRLDEWTNWSRALWKSAATCVAIMTACAAWTLWHHQQSKADFSQEFETAVFASASSDEVW